MKPLIGSLRDDRTVTAIKAEVEYLHEAEGREIDRAYQALLEQTKNHDPSLDRGSKIPVLVGLRGFEPPTFGPPDRRANQAAPQPVW